MLRRAAICGLVTLALVSWADTEEETDVLNLGPEGSVLQDLVEEQEGSTLVRGVDLKMIPLIHCSSARRESRPHVVEKEL